MHEVIKQIADLSQEQSDFMIATVVKTWRSSPRPAGSVMLVDQEGRMYGSVSGGCIEKVVLEQTLNLMSEGKAELMTFGVADEEAWEVGLSCGGKVSVFIEPYKKEVWRSVFANPDQSQVLITKMEQRPQYLNLDQLPDDVNEEVRSLIRKEQSGVVDDLFVRVMPKQPTMLMVGAAHITFELIQLAHLHGFKTIVIDPRDTFTHKSHIPEAPDELHACWPQEVINNVDLDQHTYAVILSHDPKIDDPALHVLLKSEVKYIGALGSRRTHQKRIDRLVEAGFNQSEIDRIHAPVGLDIGAMTAAEIALSVMAQVVDVKNSD
ncbi:MAG: XdhC family protein [Cyclobacteriaceae bacterium]